MSREPSRAQGRSVAHATGRADGAHPRKPIQRQTVASQALERLRENILRGDYAEGAPLRQDAIASDLGISRIPVREALRQLEAEGLVVFSAHMGAVVSSLSLGEIKELFELRALVEGDVLRRAIPRLKLAELDRAEGILDAYDTAFERGDVATWGALNWEFHSTLLAGSGQPLTLAMVQTLHNQSDRYLRMQLALTHGEHRARHEHRSILDAARRKEAQHGCALLTSHILGAGGLLLDFLRAEREAGPNSFARAL